MLMSSFRCNKLMWHGQGNGARGGMGEKQGLVAWEEITQLIVSMGLVGREARHRAQKATIPSKGV